MRIIALDFNSVARQRVKINILRQFKFQQIVYASYITYSNRFLSVHLVLFYLNIKNRFCYIQNNCFKYIDQILFQFQSKKGNMILALLL